MSEGKKTVKRVAKPVYAIMSATGGDGKPLGKNDITIHSVEKDADVVLNMMEDGTLPSGAFSKRISAS